MWAVDGRLFWVMFIIFSPSAQVVNASVSFRSYLISNSLRVAGVLRMLP